MIDNTLLPRWAVHPAPAPLKLLQHFVNTHAYSGRPDALATTTDARTWLDIHATSAAVTKLDVHRLVAAREAIRAHLRTHDRQHTPRSQGKHLELAFPRPTFSWVHADGAITLVGAGNGIDRLLNDLAASIVSASLAGSWRQLKICSNDECHVAFWDHTRNGSARYCSAAVCANRSRQRAFRERAAHP